jgi:hypothetical protein
MSATARETLLPTHMPALEQSSRRHPLRRITRHVSEIRLRHWLGAAAMRARRTDKTQSGEDGHRAYFQHLSLLVAAKSQPLSGRCKDEI